VYQHNIQGNVLYFCALRSSAEQLLGYIFLLHLKRLVQLLHGDYPIPKLTLQLHTTEIVS
jgi:hypothetical protein